MRPSTFFAAAAVTIISATARAQQQAQAVMVPTLSLSGTTTGKGKISAGLDFRTSKNSGTWDGFITPSFTVASTDGVADVIAIRPASEVKGPSDWAVGLTVGVVDRNPALLEPDPADPSYFSAIATCRTRLLLATHSDDEQKYFAEHAKLAVHLLAMAPAAVQRAVAAASTSPAGPGCSGPECTCSAATISQCDKTVLSAVLVAKVKDCGTKMDAVCDWLSTVVTPVRPSMLCKSGHDQLDSKSEHAMAERGRHVRQIWSLGAAYGTQQLKHLTGGSGPAATLTVNNPTYSNVLVGGLYTYVSPSAGDHLSAIARNRRDLIDQRLTYQIWPIGFHLSILTYRISPNGSRELQPVPDSFADVRRRIDPF